MAKGAYMSRYLIIVRFLKQRKYPTMEEIVENVKRKYDYMKEVNGVLKMGISKRTIERDFKEIRTLYEIDIEYCRKNRGYFILNNSAGHLEFLDFLESYEILSTIKSNSENIPFVLLDNRRALGLENFNIILEAIKNNKMLRFSHQKNWEHHKTSREVIPLALKEFKNRWYLISFEKNQIRTFGIDRISDLSMMNRTMEKPNDIDVLSLFKHSFGIIFEQGTPQNVLLSFPYDQARYVESLPLHKSQSLVSATDEASVYSYQIHITFDFKQELLGLGNRVKVLEPLSLAKSIAEEHRKAWAQYGA